MLNSDIAAFREDLLARDKASIIEIAVENYSIRSDMEARLHVMEQISRDMSLQYDEMRNLLKCREYETEELRKQNLHLAGVRTMQAQEMYGQISEKIVSIINERSRSKFEDPLSEDAEGSEQPEEVHTLGKVVSFGRTHKSGKGRRTTDTSSLPEVTYYAYDIEKLNEQFGEGNWRFFSWDRHETREIQRRYAYRKVTYAPVISYSLEHMLYRMPYEGSKIPKSSVSSSLLASILSDYANMHMPLFRMEHDTDRYGFPISRQTMSRWMMKVAEDLLAPVLGCMKKYLDSCTYQQGDETNPLYSDKLKDAIRYSKNQEKYLRRFLEDGNIPVDNGASERNMKPVACHRKNSLFSFSKRGADATMTIMSLIETAKANQAIPYYYLKYLFRKYVKRHLLQSRLRYR